ncbi:MAG: hypothetical protein E7295_14540 [Lachnospiraceae bacterium]|jgi:hypothetical protein|nr:hypothetical protein [Lachnospiraceae bacterium]
MKALSEKQKKQGSASRFLAILFACIGVVLLLLMVLVIAIDPFFQYHAPLNGFPYVIDDQLSQNPGLARNTTYNAVSLGSSVTTDYHITWFRDLFGVDAVKLPYNGAYPKDLANAMEQVDRSKNQLKAVFIGVDAAAYSADVTEIKYPLPKYLYDRNPFNDVNYWFNKDVLTKYVVKPLAKALLHPNAQQEDPLDYYSNYPNLIYGEEHVRSVFQLGEKSETAVSPESIREPLEKNWEANIRPMLEAHPDATFYFYFPPRSILYWYQLSWQGTLDAVLYEEELLVEHLLAYDNVEVHFLQNDTETITDLSHYTDETHFDQSISYKVLCMIKDGTYRATFENYQTYIQELKELAETYEP